jgi:hypothetical protein
MPVFPAGAAISMDDLRKTRTRAAICQAVLTLELIPHFLKGNKSLSTCPGPWLRSFHCEVSVIYSSESST